MRRIRSACLRPGEDGVDHEADELIGLLEQRAVTGGFDHRQLFDGRLDHRVPLIRVGRWLPFRAREVLNPRRGFIWAARAARLISGSDRYVGGAGAMEWKLAGLVPVMRAEGPDVSRSAAERAAAEAVWVPAALLPRFEVDWSVGPNGELVASYAIDDHPVRINLAVGDDGKVRTVTLERWGDPDGTGTFGMHTFGGEFHEHGTFEGITIPTAGRLGWHYGTARWQGGEFFRYRIVNLEPAGR